MRLSGVRQMRPGSRNVRKVFRSASISWFCSSDRLSFMSGRFSSCRPFRKMSQYRIRIKKLERTNFEILKIPKNVDGFEMMTNSIVLKNCRKENEKLDSENALIRNETLPSIRLGWAIFSNKLESWGRYGVFLAKQGPVFPPSANLMELTQQDPQCGSPPHAFAHPCFKGPLATYKISSFHHLCCLLQCYHISDKFNKRLKHLILI